MSDLNTKHPIFNVPATTLGLVITCIFFYVIRIFFPSSLVEDIYKGMIFYPLLYSEEYFQPFYYMSALTRFFTYAFLHSDFFHLVINSFFMLAFGSLLNRRLFSIKFLIISFGGAFCGAFTHLMIYGHMGAAIIGASAMVSAQMGAVCRFCFQAGYSAKTRIHAPLLSVNDFFMCQPARTFAIIWFTTNCIFAFINTGVSIAWEAHIGGFIFGFFAIGLIDNTANISMKKE